MGQTFMEEYLEYLKYELNRSSLTVKSYSHDLSEFALWLQSRAGTAYSGCIDSVDSLDIRMWLASLAKNGDTAVTVRRKAQSLRSYYRFLLKRGKIEKNPASALILPKLPKRLPDVVKSDEIENVLTIRERAEGKKDVLEIRNSLIVEMLYSLGLRRAELVALDDSDIDFSAREIKVTGKRNKQRVVPVPDELLKHIKDWQEVRDRELGNESGDNSPLLRNEKGRITTSVVYHAVKHLLSGVAASKKSPHALRHTFATEMLNGGADINTVKEFLGHASLSTTQIYTHVSFADMRKAYASAHPRSIKNGKDEEK